jgi:hypothetical protein
MITLQAGTDLSRTTPPFDARAGGGSATSLHCVRAGYPAWISASRKCGIVSLGVAADAQPAITTATSPVAKKPLRTLYNVTAREIPVHAFPTADRADVSAADEHPRNTRQDNERCPAIAHE